MYIKSRGHVSTSLMKIAGSKGKGYRAKDPASTNQNSAQNSDPACGPRGSGSHLISTSGTGAKIAGSKGKGV